MSAVFPCKGCADRTGTCHAECMKYRLYSAWRVSRKMKDHGERKAGHEIAEIQVTTAIKSKRRQNKR